jgi:hypothetical protein
MSTSSIQRELPSWTGAVLVFLVGLATLIFAVSGSYSRLMNESFRGLTGAGGILLLAMGAAGHVLVGIAWIYGERGLDQ